MADYLCQLLDDWRGDVPASGLMVEQKFDGWRALRFPGVDGQVRLWTRNGHIIEGAGHILHRLALMERMAGERLVFDGEFVVGGTLEATKAWCERGWKKGGEAGILHLFDVLPYREWLAGGSDKPRHERKAMLQALAKAVDDDPTLSWEYRPGSRGDESWRTSCPVVAHTWAHDARGALVEARRVWAAGGEGIVLKDPASPYRRSRSPAWAKVKAENKHKWMPRVSSTVGA